MLNDRREPRLLIEIECRNLNWSACAGACPSMDPNQVIDPRNNMPLEANQQPFPGQKQLLSISRLQSSIPKGGTESTWVYPSPQMFFNGDLLPAYKYYAPKHLLLGAKRLASQYSEDLFLRESLGVGDHWLKQNTETSLSWKSAEQLVKPTLLLKVVTKNDLAPSLKTDTSCTCMSDPWKCRMLLQLWSGRRKGTMWQNKTWKL